MKTIFIRHDDGNIEPIGQADSSLPDELLVQEAKKKYGEDAKIGVKDNYASPSLSFASLPDISPSPSVQGDQNIGGSMLSAASKNVVEPLLSAAKVALPVAVGISAPAAAPLTAGAGLATAYAAPEAARLLLRYARGEPVSYQDIRDAVGGTAGMFVGGATGQITPKLVQMAAERNISPLLQNIISYGSDLTGNLAADAVQKAVEQGTLTPQLDPTSTALSAGMAALSFRPNVAQARGNILAKQLDQTVAELAQKLPGVNEDMLRPLAALLHENPEYGQKVVELAVKDPRRIPSLVEEAKHLAVGITRDLIGDEQLMTQGLPARSEEFAEQAYNLKTKLKQTVQKSGDAADQSMRQEVEKALNRPLAVSESEAVDAATQLQTEAAKKIAMEMASFNNEVDAQVKNIVQSISPGVTARDAIGGSARLGEEAISRVKTAMQAREVLKNNAYNTLYQMLEATPAINEAVVPRFNDIAQADMLREIRKSLDMFGSPQLPNNADIRNVIRQFFPEIVDPGAAATAGKTNLLTSTEMLANGMGAGAVGGDKIEAKTIGDFIRSLPALNAAFEMVYSMTGENQLRDRANALYILNRLRNAVEASIDNALQAAPQIKEQWDQARSLMREYGTARATYFALNNRGANQVGEMLTSMKVGRLPQDEFKHIYSILGTEGADALKRSETRNLLAQILYSSTDPKTGTIDPNKVLRQMYDNANKLGDAYGTLARFLESDDYISREARIKALEGMVKGNLFSRIATDMDPQAVLFAQTVNPKAVNTAKAIAFDNLLKKARTPEGGFDLNAIINDPRVQRLLQERDKGGMAAFPELDALLSGGGAKLAVNNATFVSEVLKRHPFSDIDQLFDTFLASADISSKEVKAFKDVVFQAYPGQAGEEAWANLRSAFWQRMLFNPETGSPRFDRWVNATEIGYPKDFLAEMAGAGTRVYDPATKKMKVLSEDEALEKFNEWSKYIRRLQNYSSIIMAEIEHGVPKEFLARLREERKTESLLSFMGGTASTALVGAYSAGATRYFLAKLAQYGILEHWNALREARLFSSRQDFLTDKLAAAEKAFARVVKTMINSKTNAPSEQPAEGYPQLQK